MGRLVRVCDRVEATSNCTGIGGGVKLMGSWWLVELRGSGKSRRVVRWDRVCGLGLVRASE